MHIVHTPHIYYVQLVHCSPEGVLGLLGRRGRGGIAVFASQNNELAQAEEFYRFGAPLFGVHTRLRPRRTPWTVNLRA